MKRLLLVCVLLATSRLYAQGCSQCRDNVEQTPPQVQHAYRQAIVLMAGAASVLFVAALLTARKYR